MSAEETKHDLPPRWRRVYGTISTEPPYRGPALAAMTVDGAHDAATDQALDVLGLTYSEFEAMHRDRRLMNEVRASIAKAKHSFNISFDEDGWSWSASDGKGKGRPEIISALDAKPQDT